MMLLPILLVAAPAAFAAQPVPRPATSSPIHLFFIGCTRGEGVLKVVARSPRTISVESLGRQEPDGTLAVTQVVQQDKDRPERRAWRLREVQPGRLAGSLSSASGPVSGEVVGDTISLRFNMKGGLAAQQEITLAPGGDSLLNLMTIRKWGMVVGTMRETITKCRKTA
jgi:hypothetical protein